MDERVADIIRRFCGHQDGRATARANTTQSSQVCALEARPLRTSAAETNHMTAAAATGDVIDVFYGRRWAVVTCNDVLGGNTRVFPSLKIARAHFV
jgi:hypothetical protein